MSNAVKYIKELEAVGFRREQAEAQVQFVLNVLEGDPVTKGDLKSEMAAFKGEMAAFKSEFAVFKEQVESRFAKVDSRFVEMEFRIITRLGFLSITLFTLTVSILGWLIKTS